MQSNIQDEVETHRTDQDWGLWKWPRCPQRNTCPTPTASWAICSSTGKPSPAQRPLHVFTHRPRAGWAVTAAEVSWVWTHGLPEAKGSAAPRPTPSACPWFRSWVTPTFSTLWSVTLLQKKSCRGIHCKFWNTQCPRFQLCTLSTTSLSLPLFPLRSSRGQWNNSHHRRPSKEPRVLQLNNGQLTHISLG